MSLYELAILGAATPDATARLTQTIIRMVEGFGLNVGSDLLILTSEQLQYRDSKAAFSAVYIGGTPWDDEAEVAELVRASLPVIPVVVGHDDFGTVIPPDLRFANGLRSAPEDTEFTEAATAALEAIGLLRPQRRAFISYRRVESRAAAVQLHDLLSSRCFDVFLDTHDIRPGEPFQDVLWHRLVDSDVMVMLDTPTYFESKWTRQEIGRARAKEIQVLRVIWPGHSPNHLTSLSESLYLDGADLEGQDGPLTPARAHEIVLKVEKLRSLSIAARYMSITGKFRADAERVGATVGAIGAHRAISVRLLDDTIIWAYPVVGVPTAETFHDIAEKAKRANQQGAPVLIYDHIGLKEGWNAHLQWLQEQISAVRAIRVSQAAWDLAGWEPVL